MTDPSEGALRRAIAAMCSAPSITYQQEADEIAVARAIDAAVAEATTELRKQLQEEMAQVQRYGLLLDKLDHERQEREVTFAKAVAEARKTEHAQTVEWVARWMRTTILPKLCMEDNAEIAKYVTWLEARTPIRAAEARSAQEE